MSHAPKAHVRNGQVVLDEPLDLPEGTRVRIVAEPADAALEASISRGLADVRDGRLTDAEQFLAELEAEDTAP